MKDQPATPLVLNYDAKPAQYFKGIRFDMLSHLPDNPAAKILEIGCGAGETGAYALAQGKCQEYIGIELSETASEIACKNLTEVIVGNIENLQLPWTKPTFDALIMSEVLEHLVDPWSVVEKLYPLLKDGALVMASSPNVSHWKVISEQISGRWDLTEQGVMDRTHLRWFTPGSFERMFLDAGFVIDSISPVTPFRLKSRVINILTLGRSKHLFMSQINLLGHKEYDSNV